MNQNDNPPIEPTNPKNPNLSNDEFETVKMNNEKPQNPSKMSSMQSANNSPKGTVEQVTKLALKKSPTHQLKNDELQKCGVNYEECDKVRDAISKADAFRNNMFFSFLSCIFSQVGSVLDTIVKVILVLAVFLLSLQVPYINTQANDHLKDFVAEATFNYQKYEITLEQFSEIFKKYKIKGAKAEEEVPEQIKQDKATSQRWMQYKDKSVESIWKEVFKKPFAPEAKSKDKFNDLMTIYKKTLKKYQPGLPTSVTAYRDAVFVAVLFLIIFIFMQNILGLSLKSWMRGVSLKHELRKVLK
ncbi:MAG: hypothetical protein SFU25_01205 [Candidatus Caenarcaniphilales bacterium]|nr:hypothetical protein [Candidatus Caenarcaniphilales bacterium]